MWGMWLANFRKLDLVRSGAYVSDITSPNIFADVFVVCW